MIPSFAKFLTAALAAALSIPACSTAQPQRLGTIDFPTSGSPAAQPHFIRGVLFLHSFEYDSAASAFRGAQRTDPGFAMAYWGEAMTYTHPVWNEQDTAAARRALARLAPTAAVRKSKAPTAREQQYLEAVEILYGDGSKARRDTLYSAALERLIAAYPNDLEARAFHALSLLGLNQGVRDVHTYLRAAAVAQPIFKTNPDHPGAVHYIIHAFDDPANAQKGLTAARAYSKIAPGAAHAQHMTTHIFLALGMWDEVVSQNEIASGHDHDAWTPGHYTLWLNYAYLQQGRYADALHMIEGMRGRVGATPGRRAWGLTSMRGRYLIETEQWDSPVATWDIDLAPLGAGGRGYWAFVTGLRAIRRRDRDAASRALGVLSEANVASAATTAGTDPTNAILELELKALLRLAEGAGDEAVKLMREATAREDAMPFEFGPPAVVKPSHELFGEVLLQLGRPKEAGVEFQRALALAPLRARSVLGSARSAFAAGVSPQASESYAMLRSIWHRADPAQQNLAEVKAGGLPTR